MKIKGKVVYTKMLEPDTFHVGVNFNEPVEKVHQFVVTLVKNYNLEKAADKTP